MLEYYNKKIIIRKKKFIKYFNKIPIGTQIIIKDFVDFI
jgi:hypothetical protein